MSVPLAHSKPIFGAVPKMVLLVMNGPAILMEIINARNVISRVQLAMVTVQTPVTSALKDILKTRTMFASQRKQLVKLLT